MQQRHHNCCLRASPRESPMFCVALKATVFTIFKDSNKQ